MKIPKVESAVTLLIIGLIPLDYFSIFGFRLILLKVTIVIALCALGLSVRPSLLIATSVTILSYALISSLYGGDLSYLFALVVFMILALWPLLMKQSAIGKIDLQLSISTYTGVAVVVAFCVALQWVAHYLFETAILNVARFGPARVAFGALWTDFSFLSLYLASAVFLVPFTRLPTIVKLALCTLLVFGSVSTSARTGPVALLVISSLWFFAVLARDALRRKLSVKMIVAGVLAPFLVVFAIPLWGTITGRPITLRSTGRDSGSYYAIQEFLDNPLLGVAFDVNGYLERYSGLVDARPHNVLLEFALLGGLGFLALGILFVLLVFREVLLSRRNDLLLCVSCILFGFLFIPSFFSAYFFATLISLALLARRQSQAHAAAQS